MFITLNLKTYLCKQKLIPMNNINMQKHLLIIFLTIFSSIIFAQNKDSKLIGTWKSVNQEDVIYANFDKEGYVYMINNGDTIGGKNFNIRNKRGSMFYYVNTETNPKTLDYFVNFDKPEEEDKTLYGIYKFNKKGELVLCQNYKGKIRLKEFDKQSTIIFEKIKE